MPHVGPTVPLLCALLFEKRLSQWDGHCLGC